MANSNYDQHFKKVKQVRRSTENELRRMLKIKAVAHKPGTGSYLMIGVAAIGLGLGCVGYVNPSIFTKLLSSVQIGLFSSADADSVNPSANAASNAASSASSANAAGASASSTNNSSANSAGQNRNPPANDASSSLAANNSGCPATAGYSPEEISHFSKLNQREHQLDLREAELDALEKELHNQKIEVEARITKLQQIRQDIAHSLKNRVQVDQTRVDNLVNVYSSMDPAQAAKIIGGLDPDLATQILGQMKKKNAAAIMDALPAKTAQTLSEKYTGYASN